MIFNERLRAICREKNIDQNRLAELVGITQSAVSKYLNSQVPNFEIGLRIARVLRVDPHSLFAHSGRVNEEPELYGELDSIKEKIRQLDQSDRLDLLNWLNELNSN
ncbi:MAG: helix-turn-helix domain-containing protein [Calditrichaeota bacterium]|nr:helix-turn-helix domain-containing protein [Calditrichota bacterium]